MGIKETAEKILYEVYEFALDSDNINCPYSDFIDTIIDNNHLTYKYVLFTALLAKASDESINALCLQKKSTLPGAYDARTVCHKVIVPFEMNELKKVLGGSNEPFLNKPARFPELSKTNAVRRGNDQKLLNALCDNLPLIDTSSKATNCLLYLLKKLLLLKEEKHALRIFEVVEHSNLPARIYQYANRILEKSYEGESLTLMTAGLYHLAYNSPDYFIDVHPVNQAGASKREISDLDVFANGELLISNELKDKEYTESDVRHAADKVIEAGGDNLFFIEGPHGKPVGVFVEHLKKEYLDRNFLLTIINYQTMFSTLITQARTIDAHEFLDFIFAAAMDNKFKDDTIEYIDEIATEFFDLKR